MTGEVLAALAGAVPRTLALTGLALLIGTTLGPGLCAARVSPVPVLRGIAATVMLAFRSVPPILWLLLAFHGFGTGPRGAGAFAAAAVGLSLIAAARTAEVCSAALSAVPAGQWEAAAALHLPRRALAIDVIVPQLLRAALPALAADAAVLLRDSALAATIGVGEIAFAAARAAQRTPEGLAVFAAAAALYMAIGPLVAAAIRRAGRRIGAGAAR